MAPDPAKLAAFKAGVNDAAQVVEKLLGLVADVDPALQPQLLAIQTAIALIDVAVQTAKPTPAAKIEQAEKLDPLGMG